MALKTCKECGKEFSNSSKTCPHCGAKNPTTQIFQLVSVIVVIVVGIILWRSCSNIFSSSSSSKNSYTSSSQTITYTLDIRPDSQKKFEQLCRNYATEYRKGENELQKSNTRNSRRKELQQLGLRNVNNWIGTLNSQSTDSNGNATISIKLNDSLSVGNAAIEFGFGASTKIDKNSNLFQKISIMKKGDKVKFSGTLGTDDKNDYNTVLTEIFGGESSTMLSPTFLFRFSDLTVLKNKPFSTEEINLRDGPSAEANIIEALQKDTSVELLGNPAENGWVKASVNGKEGYVNSKYLTY